MGGWTFGLQNANIEHKVIGWSEVNPFAIKSYELNHCKRKFEGNKFTMTPKNYGDISKIDLKELPDFDLGCFSPPCQDFSVAGKCQGSKAERGRLFEPSIDIIKYKQPRVAVFENVKGLTAKRHKEYFDYILKLMQNAGYNVYWKVLNTKDYNVPQNRDRIFFVCFRKDIDSSMFKFPEKEELKIFLKDILEDNVDDKYYLSEEKTNQLLITVDWDKLNKDLNIIGNINPSKKGQNGNVYFGDVAPCVTTNKGEGAKILQINNPKHSNDRVYAIEGCSPTLNTMQGGHRQPFIVASRGRNPTNPSDRVTGHPTEQRLEPKLDGTSNTITSVQKDNYVLVKNATKKGYLVGVPGDGVNLEHPNSETRRGRIQKDVIGALQTNDQRGVITEDLRIRKLTPTECFRLQGFLKDQINLDGLSNTQRYKIAGNGLSINVITKLFKEIFKVVPFI